jgi:hypothetical protein
MVNTPDPVDLGLVASLAHPGGNITGVTSLSVDVSLKQLDLLKEAVPRASRIAVLWNPDNPWHPITGLAWRELVLKGRRHAEWLVSRYKALDAELARLRRQPSHPACAECFLRQQRSRGLREEYLTEIATLAGSVPTYADYRRPGPWLRRQFEGLEGGRT